ncbi:MAG: M2 family metallopeptidase [Deltaproteobacteria bacterium]|nr:M2 family metallopeptidase [Deltaproteobacteria bacterium]
MSMRALVPFVALSVAACGRGPDPLPKQLPAPTSVTPADAAPEVASPEDAAAGPSAAEAKAFVETFNREYIKLKARAETAEYIKSTYITPDTEQNAAWAQADVLGYLATAIPKAASFRDVEADPVTKRTLELVRTSPAAALPALPPPPTAAQRDELTAVSARLEGHYGSAKSCHPDPADATKQICRDLGDLSKVLATSKDWDELARAWTDWHDTAASSRPLYQRLSELGNEGARSLGFADLGELWRSPYDMSPAEFEAEIERLWQQVKPLYDKLHCVVRARLSKHWGAERVPPTGPLPTHILGNMWAQDWSSVYPLVEPHPAAEGKARASLDVTKALVAKGVDAKKMVEYGEGFFTSLGLPPLPQTFWERSMLTKPRDREVVCHASAWDVSYAGDVRIKMCIETNEDDFITIHHELGHIYYFMLYKDLPVLFQNGANDGFHEAIGDAIALGMTPKYMVDIGLFDKADEDEASTLNQQMRRALEKIAFLPFARMIDQWRWDVLAGKVGPDKWNAHWWALKRQYQGVVPPAERTEASFDPAAKFHVPASTPYMRYFLAAILQFQFHRALCQAAGHEGPLHTCSIYGNKEAGKRLAAVLAMGASKPWPDALEALTGSRTMDASAILDYFKPLSAWLDTQLAGQTCGW